MAEPLVSILIPCHNAGHWLAETLESALAQTWPHREIIVVSDGSTDDSAKIARAFAPRVTVIEQPQAGQSAAFNTAIRSARGSYYEFLDADDLLAADKIEQQILRLKNLPANWVATCPWIRFHETPVLGPAPQPGPLAEDLAPVDWLIRLWSSDWMMHGAAWLVPAEIIRRTGGWNEQLSLINDFDFFARVVLASAGVAYCANTHTLYRSGLLGSLSNQRSAAAWQSAFLSVELGTQHLLSREDSPRSREACIRAWRNLAFDSFVDAGEISLQSEKKIEALGGTLGHPPGTSWFTFASHLLGWKNALRLRRLGRTLRSP